MLEALSSCPYLRHSVLSTCGPQALKYWQSLGQTQASKDHSRCTEQNCFANNLNIATYKTRHAREDCICEFREAHPDAIKDAYSRGSFPLIAVTHTRTESTVDRIDLQVRSYDATELTPFIAISHALSGGLGNPRRPALPSCQLKQIDAWVRDTYKERFQDATDDTTFWFWMDSLCIPSHTTIMSQYSLKARRSFKRATSLSLATLVLDEDSLKLQSSSPPEESYTRITFSSWFSRMWTLQEAVATPLVLFQTIDSTIELETLVRSLASATANINHDEEVPNGSSIAQTLDITPFHDLVELRRYMTDHDYEDRRGSDAHRALLNRALSQRATTHEEDKDVIWANLLDLIMPLSRQNSCSLALDEE